MVFRSVTPVWVALTVVLAAWAVTPVRAVPPAWAARRAQAAWAARRAQAAWAARRAQAAWAARRAQAAWAARRAQAAGGTAGAGGMGGTAGAGGMGGTAGAGGMGGTAGAGGMGGMPSSASSCLDLLNAGQTTDGIYTIDVGGNPLDVYCDMTRFGGGWTQLYDQDSAQGYLPTATWAGGVNTTQPNSGQYSILNLIDDFEGTAPGFDFFIDWPAPPPGITFTYIWWSQSLNPFDGRGTVNLLSEAPVAQTGCSSGFSGLGEDGDGSAALDGDATAFCWWWAIGTATPWMGGIPAYLNSDDGQLDAPRARLWVR